MRPAYPAIDRVKKEAKKRVNKITILVDYVHVIDMLCPHYTRVLSR